MQERDILRRAEAICGGCMEAYSNLYGDERSVSVMIHKTLTGLRSISSMDSSLTAFREKLENELAGIEETARDLKDYAEKVENSQERLEEIERNIEALVHVET